MEQNYINSILTISETFIQSFKVLVNGSLVKLTFGWSNCQLCSLSKELEVSYDEVSLLFSRTNPKF